MKLVITMIEAKTAIVKHLQSIGWGSISPDQLKPMLKIEGEYDDRTETVVGFEIELTEGTLPNGGQLI